MPPIRNQTYYRYRIELIKTLIPEAGIEDEQYLALVRKSNKKIREQIENSRFNREYKPKTEFHPSNLIYKQR